MAIVTLSMQALAFVLCLSVIRIHRFVSGTGYHSDDKSHHSSSSSHDDEYSFDSHDDDHHGYGSHGLHGGLFGSGLLLSSLAGFSSITTTAGCTGVGGICLFSLFCSAPNQFDDGYDSDSSSHSHHHLGSTLNGQIIGTCNNSLICCGLLNVVSYHKKYRTRRRRRVRRRSRRRKHISY